VIDPAPTWRSFAFQLFFLCAATAFAAVTIILFAVGDSYSWILGPWQRWSSCVLWRLPRSSSF